MFEYIQDAHLTFKSTPTQRKETLGIVLHHRAGWGDVQSEHADSLARGWIGVGYNIYIRQDGSVWWGRGLATVGAHSGRTTLKNLSDWAKAAGNNSQTIGIGFEGYYHPGHARSDKAMPQVQYDAGVKLIRELPISYPTIAFIRGHREMPATNTACPGDYFPLAAMVAEAMAKPVEVVESKPSGSTTTAYKVTRALYLTSPRLRGEDVKWLQTQLNPNGASPVLVVDGDYGSKTDLAVKVYQRKKGLTVDGIVGRITTESLGGIWTK